MRRYFRIGLALWALGIGAAATARQTENVVLIVSDGLRWQEIFSGADWALLNEKEGGSWLEEKVLRQRYWREDAASRRKLLFPFLWGTVAKHGQIFGNQTKRSIAQVTNGKAYSYPGYTRWRRAIRTMRSTATSSVPIPMRRCSMAPVERAG